MSSPESNLSKSAETAPSPAIKGEQKITPENYSQAIAEKNAEFLAANIGKAENGAIPKEMISDMINTPGGAKALVSNFSKVKDGNAMELAKTIIESGKGTKVFFDNEVEYAKSKTELADAEKSSQGRRDFFKGMKTDEDAYKRNLANDEAYQKYQAKEKYLEEKIQNQEVFLTGLDKNALLAECIEKPNYLTPDKLQFFCSTEGGNRATQSLATTMELIVAKKNYDATHINALLSASEDGAFDQSLLKSLNENGYADSAVSYAKKFKQPQDAPQA